LITGDVNIEEEKELLARLRDPATRDPAFSLLVKAFRKRLYWSVRRLLISHDDTDDALQNTFVKAWRHLDRFRGESRLYTWLYKIAVNEALTILQGKKKRFFVSLEDVEPELSAFIDDVSHFTGNEIEKKLFKALSKLPEKQRLVFQLKYFDEMKYGEMSEVFGTSVGALKASYHHAVKKLEKYLLQP
jgi:RNA polymerase sigma factor (sigma-70 family)